MCSLFLGNTHDNENWLVAGMCSSILFSAVSLTSAQCVVHSTCSVKFVEWMNGYKIFSYWINFYLIKRNHLCGNESSCSPSRQREISPMGPHRRLWNVTNINHVLRVGKGFHSYFLPGPFKYWSMTSTQDRMTAIVLRWEWSLRLSQSLSSEVGLHPKGFKVLSEGQLLAALHKYWFFQQWFGNYWVEVSFMFRSSIAR